MKRAKWPFSMGLEPETLTSELGQFPNPLKTVWYWTGCVFLTGFLSKYLNIKTEQKNRLRKGEEEQRKFRLTNHIGVFEPLLLYRKEIF
jgi:hypothetical protein